MEELKKMKVSAAERLRELYDTIAKSNVRMVMVVIRDVQNG